MVGRPLRPTLLRGLRKVGAQPRGWGVPDRPCVLCAERTSDGEEAGPARSVQTTLVVISMLPWTALEYGQIPWAASARSSATLRSRPGRLTLR